MPYERREEDRHQLTLGVPEQEYGPRCATCGAELLLPRYYFCPRCYETFGLRGVEQEQWPDEIQYVIKHEAKRRRDDAQAKKRTRVISDFGKVQPTGDDLLGHDDQWDRLGLSSMPDRQGHSHTYADGHISENPWIGYNANIRKIVEDLDLWDRITPEYRAAIELKRAGYTYEEIGARIGKGRRTVKKWIRKGWAEYNAENRRGNEREHK